MVYHADNDGDLVALAEQLAATDLLIAADDVAATLAEALGRPVWKMAHASDHWSWRAEGAASKWHPGARIFRLDSGAEDHSMAAMRAALAQEVGHIG